MANEHYYAGKPKVKNFIYKITTPDTNFQLFQTGETDYDGFAANNDNIEQLKSLGFANFNIETVSSYSFVYLNNKKPYLKDKKYDKRLFTD